MDNAAAASDFSFGDPEYDPGYGDPECLEADSSRSESAGSSPQPLLMLLGICTLTLFFTPQILQLFPGLEGFQIAKVTAVAAVLIFLLSRGSWSSRLRLSASPQLKFIIAM